MEVHLIRILTLLGLIFSTSAIAGEVQPIALKSWAQSYLESPGQSVETWEKSILPNASSSDGEGRYLIQKITLPKLPFEDPSIFFYRIYNEFEIRLDGRLLRAEGNIEDRNSPDFMGYPWYLIKLPKDYMGKTLEIISFSSSSRVGIRQFPLLGNGDTLVFNLIRQELFTLVSVGLNLGLIFIVLIAAINGLVQLGTWLIAIYALCSTAFILAVSPLAQVLSSDALFWARVEQYGLYSLTFFGFWAVKEVIFNEGNYKKFLSIVLVFYGCNFGFASLTDIYDLIPFWDLVQPFNVLNEIVLSAVMVMLVLAYLKEAKELRPVIVCLLVLVIGGAVESLVGLGFLKRNYFSYSFTNFMAIAVVVNYAVRQYFRITRELADERMNASKAEVSLNKEKETAIKGLVGGVAHELNNPLAIIHGSVEILPTLLKRENSSERVERCFQRIGNALDRMVQINGALIEFGDRDPLIQKEFEVPQLYSFLQKRFENKGVAFEMDGDMEYMTLMGDLQKIVDSLSSIINNGIEAMLEVKDERDVEVSFKRLKGKLAINIVDYGVGVTEENYSDIFNPFFTSKKVSEGVGLSLFVAQQVIQGCDGRVVVYNFKDPTIFRIYFNCYQDQLGAA